MNEFLQTETIIIELLVVASLVAIVIQRIRLPYTVALVLVGLGLSFFQGMITIELTEELILALFLPPLLFEAAFHVEVKELRQNLSPILMLAIFGVIISTFVVGGLVAWGTSLTLSTALIFGALIAATDPVAVVAMFRALGAPKKLTTIIEGESLFNDGSAVVIFNIILGAALTGEFSLAEGLFEFVEVSLGGLLIGLSLGWLTAQIIRRVDNYLAETTLTAALAFGTFLIAEHFHVSGVLAVVAAGILNGNIGPEGMSPTTKIVLFNFWEYLAFLANSLIFLLIGLEIDLNAMVSNMGFIIMAYIAVTVARAISVYGLNSLAALFPGEKIPLRWQHVQVWGGLRGAVSLALALGLPVSLGADRGLIINLAFGVVFMMMLFQATTMEWLVTRLGILKKDKKEVEYDHIRGQLLAIRAAQDELEDMHNSGQLSAHAWSVLQPEYETASDEVTQELRELVENDPALETKEINSARHQLLITQRGALHALERDGLISSDAFEHLASKIDEQLDDLSEKAH